MSEQLSTGASALPGDLGLSGAWQILPLSGLYSILVCSKVDRLEDPCSYGSGPGVPRLSFRPEICLGRQRSPRSGGAQNTCRTDFEHHHSSAAVTQGVTRGGFNPTRAEPLEI